MKKKSEIENYKKLDFNKLFLDSQIVYSNNYKISLAIEMTKHLILILLFWNFISTFDFEYFQYIYGEEIYTKPSLNQYLRSEFIQKFNDYMRICKEGIMIDNTSYPLVPNPKITAIMPIYNGGKYLYYSLRSIQNQDMKDIEIILIDDCSTDDTLSIIQKYMEEDKRIRLIKNQYNRKILYSKSIAALNANGEFIIQLDQDDMFIRNDVFDMLFYEAQTNNLDLMHIRDFIKKDFKFGKIQRVNVQGGHLVFPREMHYKQQPELTQRNFVDNNNYLLWGLLIKTDIYKRAVYKLWPIIMNYKLTFHEDYTISFMIVSFARRYKYLNNFGLIHLSHSSATSKNFFDNPNYYLGIFFFATNLYHYYIKEHEREIYILVNYIYLFLNEFRAGKKIFPALFKYIARLVLNSRYLSIRSKMVFIKKLRINKINYKVNKIYLYLMGEEEFSSLSEYQNSEINTFSGSKIFLEAPVISIIMFCNEDLYLRKTINSIETQTFEKSEIIIALDKDSDISEEKINKITKQFSNIKFIKNEKCKGILCSIYNGVLAAIGANILIMQPGITFYLRDTLSDLYNEIVEADFPDIFEFGHLINNDEFVQYTTLNYYNTIYNKKIKENLASIQINEGYRSVDANKEILFNTFIKTTKLKSIMEDIFNFNQKQNLTLSLYNYYDDIILFALKRATSKKLYSRTYGTIQYINKIKRLRISQIMNDERQKIEDSIYYINYLFENTKDNMNDKMYALRAFYNILSQVFNRFIDVPKQAFELKEKFMKCNTIPEKEKINLDFYIKSLMN